MILFLTIAVVDHNNMPPPWSLDELPVIVLFSSKFGRLLPERFSKIHTPPPPKVGLPGTA